MRKKILIVEDDPDLAAVLVNCAESLATDVITESENITLSAIELLTPDLILLDHRLPIISGGDICRQIKNDEETKNIPVILISAVANLPELAAFCNADDYIIKPFEWDELTGKIKHYLKANAVEPSL